MAKSMTGFGRCQKLIDGREFTVEIKSVNHRYFEFSSKIRGSYGFLEDKLKALVSERVSRGKVDLYLYIDNSGSDAQEVKVNTALAEGYLKALKEVSKVSSSLGVPDDIKLSSLIRFSDIFSVEKPKEDEEELWRMVSEVVGVALDDFIRMREAEGDRLKSDLILRIETIRDHVAEVEKLVPKATEDYRNKLYGRLCEVLEDRNIDEQRIMLEAAIFSEKTATNEETVRLRSHLSQFVSIISSGDASGRKLDFLVQEINREVNTIGSKCQNIEISRIVIELKSEIEKIREQIQNLE